MNADAATTNRHISTILLEPIENLKILHDSPCAGKQELPPVESARDGRRLVERHA
jgi:hypothetical protein